MKVLQKIVGKAKVSRIRNQYITEYYFIQLVNE